MEPVTILGIGLSLGNLLFGEKRNRISDSDWLQVIPGNGRYSSGLRAYLKTRIHWKEDLGNVEKFSNTWIWGEYALKKYPEKYDLPIWHQIGYDQHIKQEPVYNEFMIVLNQEIQASQPGSSQYVGGGNTLPGGLMSMFSGNLIPIIAGIIIVALLVFGSKKKGK